MFRILAVLALGVTLGFIFRRFPHIHCVDQSARYTICILLFVFGVGIGSNASLMHNIGYYGLEAIVVALLGMAGSYSAANLFHYLMRKKEGRT